MLETNAFFSGSFKYRAFSAFPFPFPFLEPIPRPLIPTLSSASPHSIYVSHSWYN